MDTSEHKTEQPAAGMDSLSQSVEAGLTGSEGESGACTCPKCGLYKWYPPLLLLSTLMAGVFCVMYITKPVFLSQPVDSRIPQAQPAVEERAPGGGNGGLDPAPTAMNERTLDPAAGGLPGDETFGSGVGDSVVEALAEGFEPVVVERDGPPLFQPFVVNDEPGLPAFPASGDPGEEELESPVAATEAEREGEDPAGADSGPANGFEMVGPPRPGDIPRSDEEDFRLRASFIAEFVDPSKSLAGKDADPEQSEDAP